jgi:hypothetical protein
MRATLTGLLATLALAAACAGCGGGAAIEPAPEVPSLHLGASIAEAKREVGPTFKLPYWNPQFSSICGNFEIEGTAIRGEVVSGRIAVVAFSLEYGDDGTPVRGSGGETLKGLQPGQTLGQAEKLFGRPDKVAGGEGIGTELIYWQLGEQEGHQVLLRANIWHQPPLKGERIGALEVGITPQVEAAEGCQ